MAKKRRSLTEKLTQARERVKEAQRDTCAAARRLSEAAAKVVYLERRQECERKAVEPDPYAEAIEAPCTTCNVGPGALCLMAGTDGAQSRPHLARVRLAEREREITQRIKERAVAMFNAAAVTPEMAIRQVCQRCGARPGESCMTGPSHVPVLPHEDRVRLAAEAAKIDADIERLDGPSK